MILIGQYDSPFVRRVAIALTLYELPFTHQPWSVFGDADRLRAFNPLVRVPTLVLDDGDTVIESHHILDYLDERVGPELALFPATGVARRKALKVAALASGLGDKAVSLFYERRLHSQVSDIWVKRCRSQIQQVARVLEDDCGQRTGTYWFGNTPGHADIAVAAVWRFVGEAHPGLVLDADFPLLAAHARRLEAMAVFQSVSQAFAPPGS